MILNDNQILALCQGNDPMITPVVNMPTRVNKHGEPAISFGITSYGYDMVLGTNFKTPLQAEGARIDPKKASATRWHNFVSEKPFLLYPGSFVLGESVESWNIPSDVIGIVVGKSTYARCGIIVNVTPMEPGWRGVLTLEIHNAGQVPVYIYPSEGIAQVNFHRGDFPAVSYASKSGKYQHQTGVTEARI